MHFKKFKLCKIVENNYCFFEISNIKVFILCMFENEKVNLNRVVFGFNFLF